MLLWLPLFAVAAALADAAILNMQAVLMVQYEQVKVTQLWKYLSGTWLCIKPCEHTNTGPSTRHGLQKMLWSWDFELGGCMHVQQQYQQQQQQHLLLLLMLRQALLLLLDLASAVC